MSNTCTSKLLFANNVGIFFTCRLLFQDVNVAELPVRLLGDCLRGSAALHSSIPHSPTLRAQAALAIAQWQNNKAPASKDAVGANDWVGLKLLLQYFYERFTCTDTDGNITILPCKYTRETIQKTEGGDYQYLDEVEKEEQSEYSTEAGIEFEEDEEYRVRSAVITAIACIRAKDGQTPPLVLEFLELVIPVCDGAVFTSASENGTSRVMQQTNEVSAASALEIGEVPAFIATSPELVGGLPYVDHVLVANAILALCNVNVRPANPADLSDVGIGGSAVTIDDRSRRGSVLSFSDDVGATNIRRDSSARLLSGSFSQSVQAPTHPIQPLLDICRRWLDWALYQEATARRVDAGTQTGIGSGFFSTIPPSAITALCSLALLKQSTSRQVNRNEMSGGEVAVPADTDLDDSEKTATSSSECDKEVQEEVAMAQFYINIFDDRPTRSDVTRAAAAQAVTCIFCAVDRLKSSSEEALGLLKALKFLLDRILGEHLILIFCLNL